MATRRPTVSDLAIELAALKAAHIEAWKAFPAHLSAAIAEAWKELTPISAHSSLESRMTAVESALKDSGERHAYSAGATKAEQRQQDTFHEYAKSLLPYFMGALFLAWQYMNGGAG